MGRADLSSFQPNCHSAPENRMSLAGLGGWGVWGLGLSRQKPDSWPPGVSFVYVRKGQRLGQEGMVGIPAGEVAVSTRRGSCLREARKASHLCDAPHLCPGSALLGGWSATWW